MAQMENWNEFKDTVNSFLKGGSVDEMTASTVGVLIGKGDNNVTTQTKVTSAIKTMLEDCDGAPVGRVSALNGEALTTFTQASEAIRAVSTVFDSHPALQGLVLPNGRSKISHFPDGDAWADFLIGVMRRHAISASKAGWDGSADSLVAFQEAN